MHDNIWFQRFSASVRTFSKSHPGCSASRLASALAQLTDDKATLSCTFFGLFLNVNTPFTALPVSVS